MDQNDGHIPENDLEIYSTGALPEESAARVERHLLICEICRRRLVEAEEYLTAVKQAVRHLPRQERGHWRWSFPRLIPAFAALAVLAIAVVALPVIRRGETAPFPVSLRTMRGPASQTAGPSRRPLLLELDLTGLAASPSYRVELVDGSGDKIWQGGCNSGGATASVAVPPQKRGTYFVRVALPSGQALREYELELRGTE
jgi:hypothetical protein